MACINNKCMVSSYNQYMEEEEATKKKATRVMMHVEGGLYKKNKMGGGSWLNMIMCGVGREKRQTGHALRDCLAQILCTTALFGHCC